MALFIWTTRERATRRTQAPQTAAALLGVEHFVDVSRTMTLKTGGVTLRSSNDGWIPESLVETPREIADNQLIISPIPQTRRFNWI